MLEEHWVELVDGPVVGCVWVVGRVWVECMSEGHGGGGELDSLQKPIPKNLMVQSL